ncbi:hypothetical protein MPH_12025 [Macrophomina phaseolina MS6]|uniref:Uncharacterized protein n=1 Tax=Macrophomina phaseolina (strain MS6) TaxID=1126212 RepID=K2RDN3_MACPH|nr:hypothetical protein MPH_12025 [Macrophomina phaseolina MS6]
MMSGGKAGIERMRSGGRSARMDSIDQRGDRERLFRGNEVDEDWVDDDDTAEGFPIESEGDFDPGPRRGWRRGWSRSRTPRERGTFYQRPVPRTEPWRRGGGTFESIPLSKYADKGKGVASSGRKGGGPARRLLSDMDTSDIASFITPIGSKPAYAR